MQNAFFRRNILQIAAAATISVFAVVLLVHATTTIGEDISVGGDLTVIGALTADTPTFVVDDTNNLIGLGTTTPWALLTVGSSTPTHITLATGYRDAFVAGVLEIDGAAYFDGAITAASTLTATGAIISDSPTFVIDSTNNKIGLGTTTPWGLLTVGSSTPTHITSATGYRDAFVAGILEVDGVAYFDGAATFASTLGVTGNLTVNTDKFVVTAASGNTAVAGTLDVAGATVAAEFTQGGGLLATTTANAAETFEIADFAAYNAFDLQQTGAAAITYTLPASSTWTTVIPLAGQTREWVFYNASSTSAITFAAGTGIDLMAYTTDDDVIDGNELAELKCYRQTDTDITCLISENIHSD